MDAATVLGALLALLLFKLALAALDPFRGYPERRKAYDALPGFGVSLPLVGDLWRVYRPGRTYIQYAFEFFRRFGPTFRVWASIMPGVIISRPEDVETVLGSAKFNDKPDFLYGVVEGVFGRGLLTLNGEPWKMHRKHITPAFHFRILEHYVSIFARKGTMLADKLAARADGTTSLDVFDYFAYVTNETIFETAFGIDETTNTSIEQDRRKGFVDALEFGSYIMQKRVIYPWLLFDWVFRLVDPENKRFRDGDALMASFVDKIIKERRAALAAGRAGKKAGDYFHFLDMMLEQGGGDGEMNDDEVSGELRTFMGVQQTSSTVMSFAFIMFALHPEVQRLALEEAEEVLGSEGITYKSLMSLKYLERVLKETMRLYPVVPLVGRRSPPEDVPIVGGVIPGDTIVGVCVVGTHRLPEHWPDPLRFDPDRFLPERSAGRHPYAYLPFSAGSRNCIGQKYAMLQMKAVVASLLRRYEALPAKGCASMADIESRLDAATFLTLQGGFNVRLRPRDAAVNGQPDLLATDLGLGQAVRTC